MKILIADDYFNTWELIEADSENVAIDYIKSQGESKEAIEVLTSDYLGGNLEEARNNADTVLHITDYLED